MRNKEVAVLLTCFAEPRRAATVRRSLDGRLQSEGDVVLDTTVLQVDAKHRASVHDPRRVVMGTLTPGLTWGLFGLVAGGLRGLVIWAILGALCGGLYTYYFEHHATKAELAHIGTQLPAGSSALLAFIETSDPRRLLTATASLGPSVASVAAIADDFSVRVFSGAEFPVEVSHGSGAPTITQNTTALMSMIAVRYREPDTAGQVSSRIVKGTGDALQVELVVQTDRDGRRHVSDPTLGVVAQLKSDIVSWGLFGVLAGAISGISGGGILKAGLVTGIAWGIFGAFAGALYGLWVGRSISARRLKGIGPLLTPGTSLLLAWADGPVSQRTSDILTVSQAQHLVLHFNSVERGAVLEAS